MIAVARHVNVVSGQCLGHSSVLDDEATVKGKVDCTENTTTKSTYSEQEWQAKVKKKERGGMK